MLLSRRHLLAASAALGWAAGSSPVFASDALVEPFLRLSIPAEASPRIVALTLDACPGGFDERIAQALVQERIPATIFVTALWLKGNARALGFLLDHHDLFTLENHGARHVPPVLSDGSVCGLHAAGTLDAVRREVLDGATAITDAAHIAPRWYRGATARYSPAAMAMIEGMGLRIAGYSLNADAGVSLPAASVAARMAKARHGDVIIGHINQPHRPSGEGIVAGVKALRRDGAVFVGLPIG
jgi:peptidoglycan/xylan/chitin deacetylase (PgdA/CDA1 family)